MKPFVGLFLTALLVSAGPGAAEKGRQGTLCAALAESDGTPVFVRGLLVTGTDGYKVVEVRDECSSPLAVAVRTPYADRIEQWMTIDVAGVLATVRGARAIVDANIEVYTDADGAVLRVPVPFGHLSGFEWPWRLNAALLSPVAAPVGLRSLEALGGEFQPLAASPPVGKIGTAKQEADEETVEIAEKVVSRILASGVYYVQEPDRASGIRIEQANPPPLDEGDILTIEGEIGTTASGERFISPTSITVDDSGDPPEPLRMVNKFVTGGEWGYDPETGAGQLGIGNPGWTNNVGLLVRSWGRVTAVDEANECFYMDDGCELNDGSGLIGLRVSWDEPGQSTVTPPDEGAYVSVVGISGIAKRANGEPIRTLRLVRQSDLATEEETPSSLVVDRGLPPANLNESAGAARCNVRWADHEATKGYGDDFSLPAGDWIVDTVRVWVAPEVPLAPAYELGDHFASVTLYGGVAGGGLTELSSGAFATGGSGTNNPGISVMRVSYTGGVNYQTFDGRARQLWRIDFRNLNWSVSGQTSYAFGVLGVPRKDRKWFVHGTLVQGGQIRAFDSSSLGSGATLCGGSAWFGQEGGTDINVQVFAHEE